MIVYISIGNSDDKLDQQDWAEFIARIDGQLRTRLQKAVQIHGQWFSAPDSVWQNCCWCIDIEGDDAVEYLKGYLAGCCKIYEQDSIAWAEAPATELIQAPGEASEGCTSYFDEINLDCIRPAGHQGDHRGWWEWPQASGG